MPQSNQCNHLIIGDQAMSGGAVTMQTPNNRIQTMIKVGVTAVMTRENERWNEEN